MTYDLISNFDMKRLFLIQDIEGFTPEIGRLVSMMKWARATTLQSLGNLSVEQLDYLIDENGNSIGALLLHMAAVEVAYQKHTFEQTELNDEENKQWGAALSLGEQGRREIKGHPLTHYLEILNNVRKTTLDELKGRSDEWLFLETPWWNDKPANNYFKWVHVFEDEINHRGQIRIIKKHTSTQLT